MKVAVTGASGFLGRHVLRVLSTRPDVEIVAASRDGASLALDFPAIQHVKLDIAIPSNDGFERLGRPDVLIHLAWSGLPNYGSLRHFSTELPRQYSFLESLVLSGLQDLFVTGTCYEYGMVNGELVETIEAAPSNSYAHAKSALRRQLQFLRASRPFALTWARLFYMYGGGQPASSLYSQLVSAVARGDASFPMSNGEQLRDFLPVEAVASAITSIALHHPDAGVVNICSGQPISVRTLVERWLKVNGWNIRLDLGKYPYPAHEPLAFWGSSAKMASLLAVGNGSDAARHVAVEAHNV
jgi:nucleoside-diphosphate-sugar epimerase